MEMSKELAFWYRHKIGNIDIVRFLSPCRIATTIPDAEV